MILRDKALIWWESIEECGDNLTVRDTIKKLFLKTYLPSTACANLTNLVQRLGKPIDDYHLRVQQAYKRLYNNKPAAPNMVRASISCATPQLPMMTWQSFANRNSSSLAFMTTLERMSSKPWSTPSLRGSTLP